MSRTLPNHPASKCHPSVLPTPVKPKIPDSVGVAVGGGVVGGGVVGGVDTGGLVTADPVGLGEVFVADAEGDVLVDGAGCVGVVDRRPLDVGRAEPVAVGVFEVNPRLVPRPPSSAVLAGSDAVAGENVWLVDWLGDVGLPVFPAEPAAGVTLLVSRTAMIAMIPQAARPAPAIRRPLRLGLGPPARSGSLV